MATSPAAAHCGHASGRGDLESKPLDAPMQEDAVTIHQQIIASRRRYALTGQ
jgi:hypothetical protein